MAPRLVDYLLYESEDSGILWIRFNRPERLNALVGTAEENGTVAKVGEYMRAGDDDPSVRVIVLTGVGRAFCAGANLSANAPDAGENLPGNRGPHEGLDGTRQHFFHGFTQLHLDIAKIRKPTIAMINGPAVGSGMDMALHCDIRIGCEHTRFIAYQNAGQIIENGGSYYLPKMVGLGRALEFAYTGELDAQRAFEWGMLNHLVPSEKLEETTRDLCERIIARPWCSGSASASCARRSIPRWKPPWC
jgi:2-(1,2-epoxy-1,2-dihydrophenyl)acetyl-CoA isomerase